MAISNSIVWIGTSFGLVRLDLVSHECQTFEEMGATYHVLPIESGSVFAVNSHGLFYFNGSVWDGAIIAESGNSTFPTKRGYLMN
jgi:hypothetical protein